MKKKIWDYCTFSEAKSNIKIAVPITISQLGHMSVGIADTLMSGWLGASALAAATLGMSVFIPFLTLVIGMAYGITPLAAQNNGAQEHLENTVLLKNGLSLNMIVSLLLMGLMLIAYINFSWFIPDFEVAKLGRDFFLMQAISLLPLVVFMVLKQFSEGLSITKFATVITVIANLVNICLNYTLSKGVWLFPNLGLDGIALATVISRLLMMLAMIIYFFREPQLAIVRRVWQEAQWSISKQWMILKKSFPIGFQMMLEAGAFATAAIMAGWIGIKEIAAHQIALNLAATAYMAVTGISSAATVRVGFEYGSKQIEGIKSAAWTAVLLTILYELLSCGAFVALRDTLPKLYIDDIEIIKTTSMLLLITAFFQISDGVQVVAMGCLRGIGDVHFPTMVSGLAYWAIGLPIGFVLAIQLKIGVSGIWYGLLIGLSISAFMLIIRLNHKLGNLNQNIFEDSSS